MRLRVQFSQSVWCRANTGHNEIFNRESRGLRRNSICVLPFRAFVRKSFNLVRLLTRTLLSSGGNLFLYALCVRARNLQFQNRQSTTIEVAIIRRKRKIQTLGGERIPNVLYLPSRATPVPHHRAQSFTFVSPRVLVLLCYSDKFAFGVGRASFFFSSSLLIVAVLLLRRLLRSLNNSIERDL